jgi:hypothetical protein
VAVAKMITGHEEQLFKEWSEKANKIVASHLRDVRGARASRPAALAC